MIPLQRFLLLLPLAAFSGDALAGGSRGPSQTATEAAPVTRFEGDFFACTTEASGSSPEAARERAFELALATAARTRRSKIRYVSFVHMDGATVQGATDIVLSAQADLSLGEWKVEAERRRGNAFTAAGTLKVPRGQIDPAWETAKLVAENEGEQRVAALWRFVEAAKVREDGGAIEHGLNVLMRHAGPSAGIVHELVDVHRQLGEWDRAYLVINRYLDKVPESERAGLERLLEQYQADDEDLWLKLKDWGEYLELDGVQVLRLATLAEEKWGFGDEFERDRVECFSGRGRPWIATYRHTKTGLLFSLLPAHPSEGASLPALVARTECSEEAFASGLGAAVSDGGTRPKVRVTGTGARDWCEALGFTLPSPEAWRFYAAAAGSTPAASGGADILPADVEVGELNGFGLQGTVGNVWEWCLPGNPNAASWPLCGGSFRSSASATQASEREETPRLKRPDIGFRPILLLD